MTSTRQHGHRPHSSKHPCAGPADGTVRRSRTLALTSAPTPAVGAESITLCGCALSRARVPPHSCRGIQGVRLSRGGFVPSAPHSLRGCSSGFPRHDEILPLVLLLAAPANRSCPREMRTDHRRERDGPSAEIDRVVCAGGIAIHVRDTRAPGGGSHEYVPQGQKKQCEV